VRSGNAPSHDYAISCRARSVEICPMKKIHTLVVVLALAQACSKTPTITLVGIEPTAGQWKPWVIPSTNDFQIPPPPDEGTERDEIKAMIAVQNNADTTALKTMQYWNAGVPAYRWQEASDDLFDTTQYFLRVYALVNVAIYDATLAAWNAKYQYNRKRPLHSDGIKQLVVPPQTPAYPCEHSVTAGAAATMLAYLFPSKADSIITASKKIGESRVLAGVQYPSDVKAGFELGVNVANYIIEHWAKLDGGDKRWNGKIPTEAGYWKGQRLRHDIPNMKTWVLTSSSQFHSAPPPDIKKDMAELKAFKRTDRSNARAFRWEFEWPWGEVVDRKIMEYGLLNNAPRASRVYTLLAIAEYECQVTNIESKYVYFRIRPDQYDPKYKALFKTPPSPGYPAGHATVAGCYGEMLAYLFPTDAKEFRALAEEETLSRFEAGVHFRTDNEAGMKLGKEVANEVIKRAKADRADMTVL
jgi:membrane-associated phospholipid phosphatase